MAGLKTAAEEPPELYPSDAGARRAEFDYPAYVRRNPGDEMSLDLLLGGLHCPSCIETVENAFTDDPTVIEARVNYTARRLKLRWRGAAQKSTALVARVKAIGFEAAPYEEDAAVAQDREEEKFLLRCMAVAGFGAANVMLLSVAVWAGAFSDMGPATRALLHWVSALIALPMAVYAVRPFARSAFGALRARSLNMDVPITVAVILALSLSLVETLNQGEHAYFDAAMMLLFALLVGRYLDSLVRGRAQSAARRLSMMSALPAKMVAGDGKLRPVRADALRPGDQIQVVAGERIPADGIVRSGSGDIDRSILTGESDPETVNCGDEVLTGMLNLSGVLRINVARSGGQTRLAEIAQLMERAEQGKSRYIRIADKAARLYAPLVHGAALLTFLGWVFVGGLAWQPALIIAISVLIITCPCALGLAIPAVQVAACGRLFQSGVLVKRGDALERLAKTDFVLFDKTGTLTTGTAVLANAASIPKEAGELAASIAASSLHPLCRALVDAYGPVAALPDVTEYPGRGLEAVVDRKTIRLGSRAWAGGAPNDAPQNTGQEVWLSGHGGATVMFAFQSAARPDAAETVARFHQMGYETVLISGDRREAVEPFAAEMGISTWYADYSPEQKAAFLAGAERKGRHVLMVGDGLNDAPALAGAFVSASPAEAADISRNAADIVIQGAGLTPLADAVAVSRMAGRLVSQNLGVAVLYNLCAVPLAVAGLVTPLIAAIAMSGSSLIVTLNALRLRRPVAREG